MRKVPVNKKWFAVVSAIAASAVPSLVMARSHRIESVLQIPCVISDFAEAMEKTSNAISLLKKIGAYLDAEKAKDSQGIRPGKGKMCNSHYICRKVLWLRMENRFLVMVIRDLLNLCEITKGKDNKAVIASNIMQMTVNSSYPWLMVISRSLKENGLSNLFDNGSSSIKEYHVRGFAVSP
ncbi:large ribosomal subunit protein uL4y-like [Coffea arabica]|uniref:Large ribosomal subunit protein uL4y-like n=1 Tax=Coffea arabica TaxID=13443 RepID=A0ABM4UYJ3_COFAR